MRTSTSFLDRVLPAVDRAAERFTTLVSQADPSIRVPDSPDWTVRDVAAHLVTAAVRYGQGPRGEGPWVSSPVGLGRSTSASSRRWRR